MFFGLEKMLAHCVCVSGVHWRNNLYRYRKTRPCLIGHPIVSNDLIWFVFHFYFYFYLFSFKKNLMCKCRYFWHSSFGKASKKQGYRIFQRGARIRVLRQKICDLVNPRSKNFLPPPWNPPKKTLLGQDYIFFSFWQFYS